jgi:alanyl-tRNA synthetase/REP element-mobilizing transposase RayT
MMTSAEIRQSFLDFFKSKQHTIVPSSSLMPDSPNLLFTNAGMNQFVPIFLGQTKCPYTPGRAADTQKCIRAGGKHNDLEDVGLDTYHHTFFEMLGNWSFGDYFKKKAIEWAWELVVERWKFPPSRLYATVYSPDKTQNDPSEFDREAWDCWAEKFRAAGLDPKIHVVRGGKKDNFWMMGETGPCGPCSELHVDLTPAGDTNGKLVNAGLPQCIEIWNLVFIQFNANPDGTFSPLPARHVDTGMGFERVTAIIQGTKGFKDFAHAKISNYETDVFHPIFEALENLGGKKYGSTLPQILGSATVPVASGGARASSPASVGVPPTESSARGAAYYKRRLPHFERPWAKYMVSFPTRERKQLSPRARDIVLKSLLFGHEQRRYQLYAACVMPDHVHLLFEPQIKEQDHEGKPIFWPLAEILHSIKSFTAHEIGKAEATKGQVWENESFDRMIRGDADLEEKFHYICCNPWDSGVVPIAENYPWLWTPDAAARDAQQGDRDGRAPQNNAPNSPDQIQIDVAFRVIADHIRTLGFAIADGIQPGNNDRNYVLRRILRRAVRYGRTLGFHEPFFYKLVDVLADTMGDVFPEIHAKKKHVQEVIRTEEEAFNKTLDIGIQIFEEGVKLMEQMAVSASSSKTFGSIEVRDQSGRIRTPEVGSVSRRADGLVEKILSGDFAFRLSDTYGFPLDLTELMARERGLTVDKEGFEKLMEEQRARARAAQKKEVIEIAEAFLEYAPTQFVGFDTLEIETKALLAAPTSDVLVTEKTPFYAEMGGQVSDTGTIVLTDKLGNVEERTVRVIGVVKSAAGVFIHKYQGDISQRFKTDRKSNEIQVVAKLIVDQPRRAAIQRHHTVTHLLHWALHEVVSQDASQKGSFVGPDKLTFDFNSTPLTPQQVADVEKLVNERILENAGVSWTEVPYADVKSRKDVMQFFGEKYGDTVRVVQIGGHTAKLDGYSMELCGGTHTRATGEIGLFRIVGESAIAAGVRRIEAVAGLEAYRKAADEVALIKSLAGRVNSPIHELDKKIESLLEHQKAVEKQLKAAQQREASNAASLLLEEVKTINGIPTIIHNLGAADGDFLQAIADSLKGRFKGVIVLGGAVSGAVSLLAAVSPDFTHDAQAGKIIQQIAPIVGGKGGGRPDNARGGGRDAAKLDEALARAKALLG